GAELEKLTDEQEAKADDSTDTAASKDAVAALVQSLKSLFGEEVQDVRTTAKLTESPVCLAVEEGMMSMRMERFLVEHKQLPGSSARILEINPEHPIIASMANTLKNGGKP